MRSPVQRNLTIYDVGKVVPTGKELHNLVTLPSQPCPIGRGCRILFEASQCFALEIKIHLKETLPRGGPDGEGLSVEMHFPAFF
jgi:hypothetical protein